MPKCHRPNLTTACPKCPARAGEDCPIETERVSFAGEPVTAGTTGVCAVDGEECESCQ